MKKILFTLALMLVAFTANAQTYNYDTNGDGEVSINDVMFIVNHLLGKPNPGEEPGYLTCPDNNHPHLIDLGLPSGNKWACCNVGAGRPDGYGGYYAWGEIEIKGWYDWSTYKWCHGSYNELIKYCNDINYGYRGFTDGKTVLDVEDDAAFEYYGGGWRTPTKADFDELISNTTYDSITVSGVSGFRFKSTKNGSRIFIPSTGYHMDGDFVGSDFTYWSSTLGASQINSFTLSYNRGRMVTSLSGRCFGFSVRPVCPSIVYSYDTNGDGEISVNDVTCLVNHLLGIPNPGEMCPDDNHPHMIDLGLPSGTEWACCNVGADKPEDYGDYFAWGETTPQSDNAYSWDSYKWSKGRNNTLTKYCTDLYWGYYGFTDNKTELESEDDAARANWVGRWRMPTIAEFRELKANTTNEWTTVNGIYGFKFTGTNGRSIFLPAAGGRWDGELHFTGSDGRYWSSTLYESDPRYARRLYFRSGDVGAYTSGRNNGQSVRPVRQN